MNQNEQKEHARQMAIKNGHGHGYEQSHAGSNMYLNDEGLANRAAGNEKGTSILDQATAQYALNDRKKQHEKNETNKRINSIPERGKRK